LEAACHEHARLRVALAEHALDPAVLDEVLHEAGRGIGGEQIQVAAGIAAPAKAAHSLDGRARRPLLKITDNRGRQVVRRRQQMASGKALSLVEGLDDERLLFCPHPLKRTDASVPGSPFEIVQRADRELAIQRGDCLRSEALQMKEIENRRREFGDEVAV
jgi:hypothetical protein